MAYKSKGIGDIAKKVKILLLDIEGTTTSISFVKDELFPYAEENVHNFLESQWEKEEVKEAVSALRKLALEDQENSVEGLVKIPGEDASKVVQIEGLVGNVKWQMAADRKAGPLKQLQGLIWKQGYDNGDIKGHVFEDVAPALEQWHSVEGQKVYIYSSGSVQAQKLLFAQSLAGDLLKYIDGHFDTAVGPKQEAASYTKIVGEIGCQPEEVLFLTDIVKEAEAAEAAGLHVALVNREGNSPLPVEDAAKYPVLWSFSQLSDRKRKANDEPEQQVKVLKTDTEPEAKTDSNKEPCAKPEAAKMEVDEESLAAENKTEEPKAPTVEETKPVETVIEEVTEVSKPVEVLEMDPIVEETPEENKTNETEKMDTTEKTAEPTKENGDTEATVAEETPPKVITEIDEITDDKLDEVAEIIEDIVPVVEEPQTDEADMAELQNVGEVLEKECDEILSKVQDVTNLDSIAVKPMLNTISEENMENENLDTNDIVERILDSEQELEAEMEQCGDIDLNTVSEVVDEKKPEEAQEEVKEESIKPCSDVKNVETKIEDNKVEESSTKESTEPAGTANEAEEVAQKQGETNKTEEIIKPEEAIKHEETQKPEETAKPEEKPESLEKEVPSETETKVEKSAEDSETKAEEPKVNGNATNGNGDALAMNGDASKDEDVNSRLVAENGKEVVNGADGKTNGSGEDKEKVEPEVADIKVKTVAAAETRTDPIEPVTEA